ncbi:hypothetical protein WOLCODRAFT_123241 [Wolfiporia cocos MD-104 SS10]|uniref:Cx9C motif-containing protein 4, mitochondrial n=1 Tax=Wolfiporia cocos (strain MD-104) TaxID=742152 RepID=A0A2H3JPY7_WOLCO|nr:hypothetical protein WOLCODRAFT_123241 [Wolfiporia cocos MD-104 SS10]
MAIVANTGQKRTAPLPDPQDNAKPENYLNKFKGKAVSKFEDPCAAAAKASMECLNRNDYDRAKCTDFFQAYRDCKKEWMEQRKADRRLYCFAWRLSVS